MHASKSVSSELIECKSPFQWSFPGSTMDWGSKVLSKLNDGLGYCQVEFGVIPSLRFGRSPQNEVPKDKKCGEVDDVPVELKKRGRRVFQSSPRLSVLEDLAIRSEWYTNTASAATAHPDRRESRSCVTTILLPFSWATPCSLTFISALRTPAKMVSANTRLERRSALRSFSILPLDLLDSLIEQR